MLTLGTARARFGHLTGNRNSFTERLNQAIERLLPDANIRSTKQPARFVVYEDPAGNNVVTLPRELGTIMAGAYQAPDPNAVQNDRMFWCGRPIPIQNEWYAFAPEGPGNLKGSDRMRGIIPLSGYYTTFRDWDESRRLRIKLEEDETPGGSIIFRGRLNGVKIYTSGSEGSPLAYNGTTTVTTTQEFDEPPYQIIKPRTKGRVKLYAVDSDDVETIVGWYEPDETNPAYVRYKVPVCDGNT